MHCNQNYKHLQIRRGNAQRFRSANPVLQSGEIAYGNLPGIKFNIVKIGDGVTPWNDLPCKPCYFYIVIIKYVERATLSCKYTIE